MGFDTVMAPCNGCYHNLKKAEYDLAHDASLARGQSSACRRRPGTRPMRPARSRPSTRSTGSRKAIGEDGLKARVKNSLKGLKIANYYGCMYTRPRHIFPEKDQGPGSRIDLEAALHGRSAGRRRRRERRISR